MCTIEMIHKCKYFIGSCRRCRNLCCKECYYKNRCSKCIEIEAMSDTIITMTIKDKQVKDNGYNTDGEYKKILGEIFETTQTVTPKNMVEEKDVIIRMSETEKIQTKDDNVEDYETFMNPKMFEEEYEKEMITHTQETISLCIMQ